MNNDIQALGFYLDCMVIQDVSQLGTNPQTPQVIVDVQNEAEKVEPSDRRSFKHILWLIKQIY